jgi:ATP-binding cassette subfamily B protein RaxB
LLYSPKLALVTGAALTTYAALRFLSYGRLRVLTQQQVDGAAKLHSHLLETIRGVQAIKIAGRENARMTGQLGLMVANTNREFAYAKLNVLVASGNQLIFVAEKVIVIALGALLVLDNRFTVGMLVAYIAYKEQFTHKAVSLIDRISDLKMLGVHTERLSDIVLTEPENLEGAPEFRQELLQSVDSVEVRVDLSVRYGDGEPWILKSCRFEVAAGESVAIVGPSGCGKSTLIRALVGVVKPAEGGVYINGRSINEIGVSNYRSLVGAVMQNDELFAGSIEDNITFFDPQPDQERVLWAAEAAAILAEIENMPMRFRTLVGDMGSTLSGGQKQRVLLARALYRRPRVLILDEATSHLDLAAERAVNAAVSRLKATRIFVAHRPDTVATADRVLVMQGGRIVRTCSPEEWLASLARTVDRDRVVA